MRLCDSRSAGVASSALLATLALVSCSTPTTTESSAPQTGSVDGGVRPVTSGAPTSGVGPAPVEVLSLDREVRRASGGGTRRQTLDGAFGQEYVLYALCRGGGSLVVTNDRDAGFRWEVPCDEVPSRVSVRSGSEDAQLVLMASSDASEWSFAVARPAG